MRVLLTGGAGYIGSHAAVELVAAGHEVFIVDDFSNSKPSVLARIEEITQQAIPCKQLDVADTPALIAFCREHGIEAAIHFAGLKAVGESVADPLRYFDVNLSTAVSLCEAMLATGFRHLVFSSSATVYGEPERIPLDETCRATVLREVLEFLNGIG